ncbi:hypothetical protein MTO96_034212 [Rhipicephalus appendiculatus]
MNPLEWRNVAIPLAADDQFSRCSCYEEPGDPNDTRTVPSEEWDYYDGQSSRPLVASACILIGIAFFEVTTHDNRPLHVDIIGALTTVASDPWFGFVAPLDLHWVSNQAAYLAPTYLMAAAFFLVIESPRWLVAKKRFVEVEYVMLAAGELKDQRESPRRCASREQE